ncbi:MAG: putative sugar transferase EpsL [Planctomycetes bacterium ADurb.Bin401]|nr:MAG: putative sugar transferase EpsL [Planctomycetes bacterium ADurb.Bin401]
MVYNFFKQLFDFIFALFAIIFLLPVFVCLFIIIKITSRGPAVFKQIRAGKNGKPFTFYKFRTMKTEADPFGPSPKSGEDPRLTKIGNYLRKYSFDELPQLFNVLKGNMSLVGPRPLYVAQIAEWNDEQRKRLLVKPGITGLAQINGRGELTIEEKLAFDVEYVKEFSFMLDVKIIFITILQVLMGKSIYEKRYSKTQQTRG